MDTLINTALFKPHNFIFITVSAILGMFIAKHFMPHPATAPSNSTSRNSGSSGDTQSENDISVVDLGSPDFRSVIT